MEPSEPTDPYSAPRADMASAPAAASGAAPLPWNCMDAVTFAWETLRAHALVIVVALVAALVGSLVSMGGSIAQSLMHASRDPDLYVMGWVVYGAGIVLNMPLAVWMALGQARYALALGRGRVPEFNVLFDTSNFLTAFGATMVVMVVSLVATVVCLGPGLAVLASDGSEDLAVGLLLAGMLPYAALLIWISARWMLSTAAAADGVRGSFNALATSWRLTRGIFWMIVLFWLVLMALAIAAMLLGAIACCVGLIVTIPAAQAMVQIATVHAYLKRSGVEPVLVERAT